MPGTEWLGTSLLYYLTLYQTLLRELWTSELCKWQGSKSIDYEQWRIQGGHRRHVHPSSLEDLYLKGALRVLHYIVLYSCASHAPFIIKFILLCSPTRPLSVIPRSAPDEGPAIASKHLASHGCRLTLVCIIDVASVGFMVQRSTSTWSGNL